MIGYQLLLEINAYNLSNSTEETLRYCCAPTYVGGGYTWQPYIIDPGLFQVTLFSGAKTSGSSSYGFGEIVLNNTKASPSVLSGPIDTLSNYVFSGRTVKMYAGLKNDPFANFSCQYVAVISDASINWDTVTLSLKSIQSLFDKKLDNGLFAGNDSALEGGSELGGKARPMLIGRAKNFSPVLVDKANFTYAISPTLGVAVNQFNSGLRVYVGGIQLYFEGEASDITTAAPKAGNYMVSINGYLKLGADPKGGIVTCSAVQKDFGLKATPGNLISWLITTFGPTGVAVNADSMANLIVVDKKEVGLYIDSNTVSLSDVIDALLAPLGYWYFNHIGELAFGQVVVPTSLGTPVYYAVSNTNIVSYSREKTQGNGNGAPAKRVLLQHEHNNTVITQPLPAANAADKAWMAVPCKTTIGDTATVAHPSSQDMTIDTVRSSMLPSVVGLYTVIREIVTVEIIRTDFLTASAILPGQCVSLDLKGRFGYSGKKTMVVGIILNYVTETVTLTLWS